MLVYSLSVMVLSSSTSNFLKNSVFFYAKLLASFAYLKSSSCRNLVSSASSRSLFSFSCYCCCCYCSYSCFCLRSSYSFYFWAASGSTFGALFCIGSTFGALFGAGLTFGALFGAGLTIILLTTEF